jgi:hypothetical protein
MSSPPAANPPVGQSTPPFDEDIEILKEAIREQERLIDSQTEGMSELDKKAEHLISLSVLTLGAAAALGVYLIDHVCGAGRLLLVVLMLGAAATIFAIIEFTICYVGLKGVLERKAAPDPEWIKKKAADPEWTLIEQYLAVIQGLADAFATNRAAMDTNVTHRRRGVFGLLAGFLLLALAAFLFLVLAALETRCSTGV